MRLNKEERKLLKEIEKRSIHRIYQRIYYTRKTIQKKNCAVLDIENLIKIIKKLLNY